VDEITQGHHSSTTAYSNLGYKDVPLKKLKLLPPGGFVINDMNGVPLVAHFPGIYKESQVVSLHYLMT
jgi:hypothetical protein